MSLDSPKALLETFSRKNLNDKFCIIPFINMIFNPNGEISICRQKGTEHIVGDLKLNSIDEIWNNDYMQKWRQEFLDGEPVICSKEITRDHCNLAFEQYSYFDEVQLSPVQRNHFKKLTANLNGKCNLRCVMCDVWQQENGFYNEDNFWSLGRQDLFKNLKEVELLSGEPFIQQDTFKLIDEVYDVNPSCIWSFTSNLHWNYSHKIENALSKIKIKNFIISIDSLHGELFSKIRLGGNLSKVYQNIEKLVQFQNKYDKKLNLTVHFLIMRNNYHELENVIKFVDKYQMKVIFNVCVEPDEFSLLSLNLGERISIFGEILKENNWPVLIRIMRVLLSLIDSFPKNEKILAFDEINSIKKVYEKRPQSFV